MKQLNCLIVILVLEAIGILFVRGTLTPVLQQTSNLATVTAKIIKSCYGEKVNEIGLAGDTSDCLGALMSSGDSIATVSINSNERSVQSDRVSRWSRYKLQVFVVTSASPPELKRVLVDIKNSRWWNHMAQFYIFDPSGKGKGCSEVFEFLWTAWMMDIFGAKIICNDGADGALIYAFNPYTDYAPHPWKLERTYQGVNDHPWALLVRKYNEKRNVCENIDFNPTREVDGYEIRLAMLQSDTFSNLTKTGKISLFKQTGTLLRMISRYMNVTLNMIPYQKNPYGHIDKDEKDRDGLGNLTKDRIDVVWIVVPVAALATLPGNYPHLYQKMFAVTQYTAYMTQWQKVISAIDYSSRIGLCVVIIANVIVLKYILRQSFMTAVLNTIRMIANSCFTKLPGNLGPRIYLAGLFCFVVVIQALYQGQLAALLSKQIRFPNINNAEDLIKSDYVIYGWRNDSTAYTNPAFEGRFVAIDILREKCVEHVLLNSSITCVGARQMLMNDAIKSKLHMSTRPVLEIPVTAVVRRNWPLEERLNRHNSHYLESGLFNYDYEKNFAAGHRTLELNENAISDDDFRILTLADLDFAFLILGFGLGCATISFIVEFYVGKRHSVKPKTRLCLWH